MATAWVTITESDLEDYLVAAQLNALKNAALGDTQGNPFDRVMPDVVQRVRLKIASCRTNLLSATANSVPPELKWAACYLVIEALQVRLPGLRLTEDQKAQVKRAVEQLDRIADCKDLVSEPVDPVESGAQSGGTISVVSGTCREATREKMAGL